MGLLEGPSGIVNHGVEQDIASIRTTTSEVSPSYSETTTGGVSAALMTIVT
jgi:hypothetical protein